MAVAHSVPWQGSIADHVRQIGTSSQHHQSFCERQIQYMIIGTCSTKNIHIKFILIAIHYVSTVSKKIYAVKLYLNDGICDLYIDALLMGGGMA